MLAIQVSLASKINWPELAIDTAVCVSTAGGDARLACTNHAVAKSSGKTNDKLGNLHVYM